MKTVKKSPKKQKKHLLEYGSVVFGVGLAIAVLAAILSSTFGFEQTTLRVIFATLVILGIVIGFLNITTQEATSFMVASITLVLLSGPFLGAISQTFNAQGVVLRDLFTNIISLVVPAAIIVSLRTFIITAKDE